MTSTAALRPQILIIIGAYLPGIQAGGPVRTTSNMVNWLGDTYQFKILTVNHDFNSKVAYTNIEKGRWYTVGKAQVRYLFPDELALLDFKTVLQETSWDLIYLDSILATLSIKFLLLYQSGQIGYKPVIIVPRGNLKLSARSIKPRKKSIYLWFARNIGLYKGLYWHASNDKEREEVLKKKKKKMIKSIEVCSNIPMPVDQLTANNFTEKKPGSLRLAMMCRISRVKNLHFAIELLKHIQYGSIQMDIYGTLEDEEYWDECKKIIQEIPKNITIKYRGFVPYDEVGKTLADYHLFISPTLGENFGQAILEALCAGCPVLISNTTPWHNLEQRGVGWDLPLDQPKAFLDSLRTVLALDQEGFNKLSASARAFGVDYLENSGVVNQMKQFFDDKERLLHHLFNEN